MKKIILITGRMYSGKDYFAKKLTEYLLDKGHSVWKTAYAWKLKELVANYFHYNKTGPILNPDQILSGLLDRAALCATELKYIAGSLYVDNPKIKSRRNFKPEIMQPIIDTIKNNHIGSITDSQAGRRILQLFGTEVVRNNISESLWVDFVKNRVDRISDALDFVIVTDYRFPNEMIPGAYTIKMVTTDEQRSLFSGQSVEKIQEMSNHPSETQIDDLPVECFVPNTRSFGQFETSLDDIYKEINR